MSMEKICSPSWRIQLGFSKIISSKQGQVWYRITSTEKRSKLVGMVLSDIDIRDTQSKEVSAHADFPGWLEMY